MELSRRATSVPACALECLVNSLQESELVPANINGGRIATSPSFVEPRSPPAIVTFSPVFDLELGGTPQEQQFRRTRPAHLHREAQEPPISLRPLAPAACSSAAQEALRPQAAGLLLRSAGGSGVGGVAPAAALDRSQSDLQVGATSCRGPPCYLERRRALGRRGHGGTVLRTEQPVTQVMLSHHAGAKGAALQPPSALNPAAERLQEHCTPTSDLEIELSRRLRAFRIARIAKPPSTTISTTATSDTTTPNPAPNSAASTIAAAVGAPSSAGPSGPTPGEVETLALQLQSEGFLVHILDGQRLLGKDVRSCLRTLKHRFVVCMGRSPAPGPGRRLQQGNERRLGSYQEGGVQPQAQSQAQAQGQQPAVRLTEPLVVEVRFREQFLIAQPSRDYEHLLLALPVVFVGPLRRLDAAVEIVAAQVAAVFREAGRPLPPWRTKGAMMSKWAPSQLAELERGMRMAAAAQLQEQKEQKVQQQQREQQEQGEQRQGQQRVKQWPQQQPGWGLPAAPQQGDIDRSWGSGIADMAPYGIPMIEPSSVSEPLLCIAAGLARGVPADGTDPDKDGSDPRVTGLLRGWGTDDDTFRSRMQRTFNGLGAGAHMGGVEGQDEGTDPWDSRGASSGVPKSTMGPGRSLRSPFMIAAAVAAAPLPHDADMVLPVASVALTSPVASAFPSSLLPPHPPDDALCQGADLPVSSGAAAAAVAAIHAHGDAAPPASQAPAASGSEEGAAQAASPSSCLLTFPRLPEVEPPPACANAQSLLAPLAPPRQLGQQERQQQQQPAAQQGEGVAEENAGSPGLGPHARALPPPLRSAFSPFASVSMPEGFTEPGNGAGGGTSDGSDPFDSAAAAAPRSQDGAAAAVALIRSPFAAAGSIGSPQQPEFTLKHSALTPAAQHQYYLEDQMYEQYGGRDVGQRDAISGAAPSGGGGAWRGGGPTMPVPTPPRPAPLHGAVTAAGPHPAGGLDAAAGAIAGIGAAGLDALLRHQPLASGALAPRPPGGGANGVYGTNALPPAASAAANSFPTTLPYPKPDILCITRRSSSDLSRAASKVKNAKSLLAAALRRATGAVTGAVTGAMSGAASTTAAPGGGGSGPGGLVHLPQPNGELQAISERAESEAACSNPQLPPPAPAAGRGATSLADGGSLGVGGAAAAGAPAGAAAPHRVALAGGVLTRPPDCEPVWARIATVRWDPKKN